MQGIPLLTLGIQWVHPTTRVYSGYTSLPYTCCHEAHSAACSPWASGPQRGAECCPFSLFLYHNEAQSAALSPCFNVGNEAQSAVLSSCFEVGNEAQSAALSPLFFGRFGLKPLRRLLSFLPVY